MAKALKFVFSTHSIHVTVSSVMKNFKSCCLIAIIALAHQPCVNLKSQHIKKRNNRDCFFHINDANFEADAYWKSFEARSFKTDVTHFESVASPHTLCSLLVCIEFKRVSVPFLITFSCIFNKFAFKICNIIPSSLRWTGHTWDKCANCQFNSFAFSFCFDFQLITSSDEGIRKQHFENYSASKSLMTAQSRQ